MEHCSSTRRIHKPPEQRREEILAAATAVFSERGYRLTDVQDVATKAGVGKGTVYRFFPTKEELFLSTVAAALDDLSALGSRALEAADPLERIRGGVHAYLRFFDERPEVVELFIQERAEFPDQAKPTYFLYEESDFRQWVAVYEELVTAGRARPVSPEEAFRTLGDLLYGTVLSQHLAARPGRTEARAEFILDLFLNGLLESPRPPQG